jgi:hypothetical protein
VGQSSVYFVQPIIRIAQYVIPPSKIRVSCLGCVQSGGLQVYCPYEQTHIGCMEDRIGTRNQNDAQRQRWMPAGEKRHSTRDYSVVNFILLNISSNIKKRSDVIFIPWSFLRHGLTAQRRRVSSKSSLDKRMKVESSSRSNKARWALHEGSSGEGVQN